jgi:hypothetical protein
MRRVRRRCPSGDGDAADQHAGQTVSAPDDFYRCESCGEEFYTPGMMDATPRAGADAARGRLTAAP